MTNSATGFPPIADRRARILILGSMPGQASLAAGQYYAHERNAFWGIMGRLFMAGPELDYAERGKRLRAAHIAIWDVLQRCQRSGSLDSSIDTSSMKVNDFNSFLEQHPDIEIICFNGRKAEEIFMRRIAASLGPRLGAIRLCRLPSTSPAYAGLSFEQKLRRWHRILSSRSARATGRE